MSTDSERVYRSGILYWATFAFAIGFGGYCIVVAFLAAIGVMQFGHHSGVGGRIESTTMMLIFGASAVLIWARLGRSVLRVTADRLIVQNPFRSYELTRADIAALTPSSGGSWAFLVTKDGRRIPVFALSTGLRWTLGKRLARVAAELGLP